MPRLITSTSEFYYQKRGGKEFIETFKAYWPKSVELIVYYEGDIIRDDDENVKWKWFEEIEEWGVWERRISHWPVMNGAMGGRYEVQTDARHWRKAFIEAHAVNRYKGKVFWCDSDVVTFDTVPDNFLDSLLPDDKMCCYLGRKNFYSETGFIGWNGDHPLTQEFFKAYLDFFRTGAIFTCPSWHDCMGFDQVRELINKINPATTELFVDLAANVEENMHPWINSVLGKYTDHMKGKRKNQGSWKEDLVVERTEPYWRDRKARPSNIFTLDIDAATNSPPQESKAESSTQPAA